MLGCYWSSVRFVFVFGFVFGLAASNFDADVAAARFDLDGDVSVAAVCNFAGDLAATGFLMAAGYLVVACFNSLRLFALAALPDSVALVWILLLVLVNSFSLVELLSLLLVSKRLFLLVLLATVS